MLKLSTQGISIFNAFNAMYVKAVNTKHIHMFLSITFLIFNQFSIQKKFGKAETKGFLTIPSNTIYVVVNGGLLFFPPWLLSYGHQVHTGLVTSTILLHHLCMSCKWQPPGLPLASHLAMRVDACVATTHVHPT